MSTSLDALITRFDRTADAMCDDLRACGWIEDESSQRWSSPDGKLSLRMAAAWDRARADALTAWRRA